MAGAPCIGSRQSMIFPVMTRLLSASHPDSGNPGRPRPSIPRGGLLLALLGLLLLPGLLFATEGGYQPSLIQFCTPVEFILFAVTLLGVALFHNPPSWSPWAGWWSLLRSS